MLIFTVTMVLLKVQANEGKEKKDIQVEKKDLMLFLCVDNMILHKEIPKEFTRNY